MTIHSYKNAGMSLIELMIALVLGLILVAGVIQLFLGSRITYTSGEALARVQENGRFALEMIKPAFRDTGAVSFCGGQIPIANRLNPSCANNASELFRHPMLGWEYPGTGPGDEYTIEGTEPDGGNWENGGGLALPFELRNPDVRVVPGTDVILLRSLLLCPDLTGSTNGNQLGFPNTTPPEAINCVGQGQITLVTDCATGADLFQNQSNDGSNNLNAGNSNCNNPGPGNSNPGPNFWSTDYNDNAQIYRVVPQVFYIGYSDNSDGNCAQTALSGECGEPGLWRVDYSRGLGNAARHEELVRGVENMQILYGLSNPAPAGDGRSVDEWLTAGNIALADWPRVIAIHVALIVRSPDNADTALTERVFRLGALGGLDPVTIDYEDAGDRRLRHTFESTVAVRNQMRR